MSAAGIGVSVRLALIGAANDLHFKVTRETVAAASEKVAAAVADLARLRAMLTLAETGNVPLHELAAREEAKRLAEPGASRKGAE